MYTIHYQEDHGKPHQRVTRRQLRQLVGSTQYGRAVASAIYNYRNRVTPEIEAFVRGSLAGCVVLALWTSRGNIYVEARAN